MLSFEPGFSLSDIDAVEVDEVDCDFLDVVAEDIVKGGGRGCRYYVLKSKSFQMCLAWSFKWNYIFFHLPFPCGQRINLYL